MGGTGRPRCTDLGPQGGVVRERGREGDKDVDVFQGTRRMTACPYSAARTGRPDVRPVQDGVEGS